ncbi:MAG: cupin-like domain-containing protein [Steroidobacteraceae bacterium]
MGGGGTQARHLHSARAVPHSVHRPAQTQVRPSAAEPGDALLIPNLWWHDVESLESVNLSVNVGWCDAGDCAAGCSSTRRSAPTGERGGPIPSRATARYPRSSHRKESGKHGRAGDPVADPMHGRAARGGDRPTALGGARPRGGDAAGR